MGAHPVNWRVSPFLAPWQTKILSDMIKRCPEDRGTLWFLSSGTQSVNQVKAIGLSRAAIEASARAVNAFLKAGARDRWLVCLPEYHVGGYMIGVRAALSRSKISRLKKWDARKFIDVVEKEKVTLTSLVPTQIFDLVETRSRAPACLRAIVVGGGALDPALYREARGMGWPVLPSYGQTETASQVATASLSSLRDKEKHFPPLHVLDHARLQMRNGRLISADSLCHWIARGDGEGQFTLEDPRRDGWLATEDIAEKVKGGWRVLGRGDDVVKVLGVLVPLHQVESDIRAELLGKKIPGDLILLARPEPRAENELCLVTDTKVALRHVADVVDGYNGKVAGPFRVGKLIWIPRIPRNELGKAGKAALKEDLFGGPRPV